MSQRILFLASGLEGASCRFRVLQYLPYLRRLGVEADVADLHAPLAVRHRILRTVRGYDVVVIHRVLLNPFELRWLRAAKSYVFDFDDAIMFRDSSHRRFESWQRRWAFQRMVAGARTVIAGNDYLAAWAARYAERVTVIPTAIDLAAYPARRAADSHEPIVGWIGTRINLMYLRGILPALSRLARLRPQATLKIVSDGFLDVPGMAVIKKPWSLADEVSDLASFQVGIMPLPDDPWTRGKCALKILQYFAASVPVVGSPVGTNLDVVQHGVNGYFAATEDEWVGHLDALLADADTRRRFGECGRQTVEQRFGIQSTLDQLVGVLGLR